MYYKEICCEIRFLPEDLGQQWLKFMSVNEPLPAPQRDSARDYTGETILTSARDPTPARPACTRTQAQARQTGERSYANIGLYPYTFSSMHSSDNYVTFSRLTICRIRNRRFSKEIRAINFRFRKEDPQNNECSRLKAVSLN